MSALPIKIDADQAARHLELLDPSTDNFIFAAFADVKGTGRAPWHRLSKLVEALPALDRMQSNGYGIFVAVNDFHGTKRRKQEIARVRSVWCERDAPGKCLPLKPSFRVRTSPGRGHDYLLIAREDPLTPEDADAINTVIVETYGGDRNARDLARVLRLAGSWNLKKAPFQATIIGGNGCRYGSCELLRALQPTSKRTPPSNELANRLPHRGNRGGDRQYRYARSILAQDLPRLASMQPNTGRNSSAFLLTCRIGRWCHAGVLNTRLVVDEIVAACITNGLVAENGVEAVRATIASGLRVSAQDALPELGPSNNQGTPT
jgi:RepB DNA-primase from phage plasmid